MTLTLTLTLTLTRDGTATLHLQNATKSGRAIHEWGASVFDSPITRSQGSVVSVRAVDLASWIR